MITQKKSEELALRVLPEVASARMRAVMVAGAQLFQSKSAIDSRISAREQARDAVSDGGTGECGVFRAGGGCGGALR